MLDSQLQSVILMELLLLPSQVIKNLVLLKIEENTGGVVTVGTVAEQMLYEIGDPAAYILPDVICDWTNVQIVQQGTNRVLVKGARGIFYVMWHEYFRKTSYSLL
jgi:hypothetical protein